MSSASESDLLNKMNVDFEDEDFNLFGFLKQNDKSRKDTSDHTLKIEENFGLGDASINERNTILSPSWLESCITEPGTLSKNMDAIIMKEEYQSLKTALIRLHHTWTFQHTRLENSVKEMEYKFESQTPPSSLASNSSQINSNSTSSSSNDVQMLDSKGQDFAKGPSDRKDALAATKRKPSCLGMNEVCGLTAAKQFLYQAVVMPTKLPHLFQGLRKPWNKILLYGPPGTGKTLLAHAVAAEIDAEFYCIAASDLLSSWLGESEKLIKEMFNLKPDQKKIVLFIDEIDSLCRQRTSGEADHSRRLKTEILIQMDSMAAEGIFFIGATNCPWDLDSAFLRRFQRKIFIEAPDKSARLAMFAKYESMFEPGAAIDWTVVVEQSEGFSGADVHHLAQHAMMQPIRELMTQRFWAFNADGRIHPTTELNPEAMECTLDEAPRHLVSARYVNISDFLEALQWSTSTMSAADKKNFENFTLQ